MLGSAHFARCENSHKVTPVFRIASLFFKRTDNRTLNRLPIMGSTAVMAPAVILETTTDVEDSTRSQLETQPERYASEPADRARLAEPLTFPFSGRTTANRLMKAAMTEQLCTYDYHHPENNGIPTKNLERVYERWGRGGIGLILSGNISKVCQELGNT